MPAGLCKLPTGLPRPDTSTLEARRKFLSQFFTRGSWRQGWPPPSSRILLAKSSLCLHDNFHLNSLDEWIVPNKPVQQAPVQPCKEPDPWSSCCSRVTPHYVQAPGMYTRCCKLEKSAQVTREMENYSIDILSVSGYRWSGTDCIKLKNNNKIMNYSGSPAGGKERAAPTVSDTTQRAQRDGIRDNQQWRHRYTGQGSRQGRKPSQHCHVRKPSSKTSYRPPLRAAHPHCHG